MKVHFLIHNGHQGSLTEFHDLSSDFEGKR